MRKLRVHVLQHYDSTGPGTVLDWLKAKGHDYKVVKPYSGDLFPNVDETDMVIVCGGSMNVDDVAAHPWLTAEKQFLREAAGQRKTLLGLCLGGQLLAQILGAAVKRHEHWEVGWHAVHLGTSPDARLMVYQWHQDTFDIPPGGIRLATNRITENQAFAYGDQIIGLQFHPESTEEWIRECAADEDYPTGPHVQGREQMLEGMIFLHPMKKWFFTLLDRMEAVTFKRKEAAATAAANVR